MGRIAGHFGPLLPGNIHGGHTHSRGHQSELSPVSRGVLNLCSHAFVCATLVGKSFRRKAGIGPDDRFGNLGVLDGL